MILIVLFAMVVCATNYQDNVFVILSGSKFYFNYRHTLNAIQLYEFLKSTGITDDQILLMVPMDHACNPRNPFPGTLYHNEEHD
jgi:phosphatidylinositol glycan class K